jgi:hypothetical protein
MIDDLYILGRPKSEPAPLYMGAGENADANEMRRNGR